MAHLPLLPHNPYPRHPLVRGNEPFDPSRQNNRPPGGNGNQSGNRAISSVNFAFNYTDGSINKNFPTASRVASQGFTTPIGLVMASLSSSLLNQTSDGILGVIVARDVGITLNVQENSGDILVDHYCQMGLGHSMRSGIGFADDFAPYYGSNEKIAIYIMSAGTGFANNKAMASVNLRYFQQT